MAIEGWLEQVNEHYVAGWAFDSQYPETHLTVSIRCGDRTLGEARCNLFRPDLLAVRVGKGNHGFTFNFIPPLTSADIGGISASISGKTLPFHVPLPGTEAGVSAQTMRALAPEFPPNNLEPQTPVSYPVFVLGAARSGTTAMAAALANSTKYVGFHEGQFFDVAFHLARAIQDFYDLKYDDRHFVGTMINNIPQDYFQDTIFSVIRKLANQLFSSSYWVDKTPNANIIRCVPIFQRIWPEAKFIYMMRRGIENVMSRIRKFPNSISFREHCLDWTQIMKIWELKKPSVDRCIEIDQRDMLVNPEQTAMRVGLLLGLDEDERASLGAHLRHIHPQRTANDYFDVPALNETGWSSEQIAIFQDICGATMRKFGYGFGKNYYQHMALEPQG